MKHGVPSQKQIYLRGMAGRKPPVPVSHKGLEQAAQLKLSAEAYAYIAGGAGAGKTMQENRKAFDRYLLEARMMQSVPEVDLSINILGKSYPTPLLAAPVGVLELAHYEADIAVAKACARFGIPFVFSSQASVDMEACAVEMKDGPRWFQLYWSKSDDLVRSFVSRAERCECEVIVVTLDTTTLGWRPEDLDLGYLPFLRGMGLAQYSSDPVFLSMVEENLRNPPSVESETPAVNLTTLQNIFQLCRN